MTNSGPGRAPKGIRRHYSEEEIEEVMSSPLPAASRRLGRPYTGVKLKNDREKGIKRDSHWKDPSGKYLFQEETKGLASRNGHPWEAWEDEYLLKNVHEEPLRDKALFLKRTYRAVESRRRDLLRKIDRDL